MVCEMEQANLDEVLALLDAATAEYDALVWTIAGLTGQAQAAAQALEMCLQMQGQAGVPEMEKATPSSDDNNVSKAIKKMRAAGKLMKEWLRR
jgi:hypothetical protein